LTLIIKQSLIEDKRSLKAKSIWRSYQICLKFTLSRQNRLYLWT